MRVEAGDSLWRVGLAGGSGCWSVLGDESGAGGGALDRLAEFDNRSIDSVGGCSLVEASVGAVLVVVGDEVVEEPGELALVPDQG